MHRGVVEEALLIRAGHQVVELSVAVSVHCQNGLVELLLGLWWRNVGFNAVDRLNSVFLSRLLELDVRGHVSVLGDSQSLHAELFDALNVVFRELMAVS